MVLNVSQPVHAIRKADSCYAQLVPMPLLINCEQFVIMFFEIQQTFVGIDNLFQVGHFVGEKCKIMIVVI